MPPTCLLACRNEFEATLRDELADRGVAPACIRRVAPGLVGLTGAAEAPRGLVFERQRLPRPGFVPLEALRPIADDTVDRVLAGPAAGTGPWIVHAYLASDDAPGDLAKRLSGIVNTLLRLFDRRHPAAGDRRRERMPPGRPVDVLQLCLASEGLWHSFAPAAALVSQDPGGRTRMRVDPQAPSRSNLKIEEAFARMGEQPQAGQRVVDLGAAPGGWTWAFLQRGCSVLAVDHGPLRLPQVEIGSVRHLRENGITFRPPGAWLPLDWLVADMLIAPGVALGLLRRWLQERAMRRFVVNVKLPQEKPYAALKPILELLERTPGVRAEVRQLYHDRREVTAMGRLDPAGTANGSED